MSDKVPVTEIMKAMDKAIDTMKAYHEVAEPNNSAIHWIRINGFLTGVLIDLFWDADNQKRQEIEQNAQDAFRHLGLRVAGKK